MYERKPAIPGVEQAGRSVPRAPRSYGRLVVLLLALVVAAGGAAYWWTHRAPPIPPGIAWSNGRLEEDEIDIQTKLAERIAAIMVDEGDTVHAGQVLATMDVRDLQAQLEKAKADQAAAEQVIAQAQADLVTAQSAAALAQREVARTQSLVPQGFATQELLEQRQDTVNATQSALHSITARIAAATAARDSAKHTAESIKINIDDATLVAPHDGVILYRFANVGEVLGAGGKIYTMLDTSYVYMDVFLPTREAGQAMPRSEARILLDSRPGKPIAAHVAFVADQNQFTPKMVETHTERDNLMFRVRLRVDQSALDAAGKLSAGLPGVGFVRLDPNAPWPTSAPRS